MKKYKIPENAKKNSKQWSGKHKSRRLFFDPISHPQDKSKKATSSENNKQGEHLCAR